MASVAVTSVTPVTKGKCHARHAPRGRDIRRDTRRHPLRGVSRCHACHAGLSFRKGGSDRDKSAFGATAGSGNLGAVLLARSDRTASLPRRPYDSLVGFPVPLRGLRPSFRGQGSGRFWKVPQPAVREAPSARHSGAEGSRTQVGAGLRSGSRTHRHSQRMPIRYHPKPCSVAHALGAACLSAATRLYSAARAAARFSCTAPRSSGPSIATARASDASAAFWRPASILVAGSVHSRCASNVSRVVSRSQGVMPGPTRSTTAIHGLSACARGHGTPHLLNRSVKASPASPLSGDFLVDPAIARCLR